MGSWRRSSSCRLRWPGSRRCSARSGRSLRRTIHGVGAAGAIALINSTGNIGGFVGPYLLGYVHDRTQGFGAGLVAVGAILVVGGALVLAVPPNIATKDMTDANGKTLNVERRTLNAERRTQNAERRTLNVERRS